MALATEHLTFNVSRGSHEAAGIGELGPGLHDLRVTYQATAGGFYFVELNNSGNLGTMYDVEVQTMSSVTFLCPASVESGIGVWSG